MKLFAPRQRMSRLADSLLALPRRFLAGEIVVSVEGLLLAASLFFALFCNGLFLSGALAGHDPAQWRTWLFGGALVAALTALHFLLLGLVSTRWTVKPLLVLLFVGTACAVYFMGRYKVYLNTAMLRNVLATDVREARDLFAWSLLPQLALYAALPIWVMSRLRLARRSFGRALAVRLLSMLAALGVLGGVVFIHYQELASLMRNDRELRFRVTPANYLYSLSQALRGQAAEVDRPRAPIGEDAAKGPSWATRNKPVVLVMVLGETARAANWGLSGYARQTTPELAAEPDLINFTDVSSCGTDTETSLPCIFSPWGRRHYDESRIRNSESLLDVAARAGFRVVWIDNQSGCKGVCRGVESLRPDPARTPDLCPGGECWDGALVDALTRQVADTPGNLLVVLHQMGNHGPAYFKRYPDEFRQFLPACDNPDLPKCSAESIVNAYDNALRYTDHVLAATIHALRGQKAHDAALLYVSDHGESLGENGIYLHGIPYKIAPAVQTHVPMVMWLSEGYRHSFGIDPACLGGLAHAPLSQDNIFHTLLGLLDVHAGVYESGMDFTAGCRKG